MSSIIRIRRLPASRWRDYRDLRLEALKNDPSAFGSSHGEELKVTEDEWRRRMKHVLFAFRGETPVAMIVYVFDRGIKTKHIAEIYSFYVRAGHRGEGIGTALIEQTLRLIRKKRTIVKVRLYVNPEQEVAVGIYKKVGFLVTGKMEKELKIGRRFYSMLMMEMMLR